MQASQWTASTSPPSAHGDGEMNGLPIWAKLVAQVGAPIVFAAWLMWIVTSSLAEVRTQHSTILTKVQGHVEDAERVISLLERICRRLGKTDMEREACH